MSDATLKTRVEDLEQQVAQLMERVFSPPQNRNWRTTIGMFDGDAFMPEIDEEGRKIRQAERERT